MSSGLTLSGKNVLVTGGAGFVGSHIVDALVQEGARVRVVDNFVRGGETNLAWAQEHGQVELFSGDIREKSLCDKALQDVQVVFHQAALRVNRCEENPQECWDVMVQATFDLLAACAKRGVQKIVAASSAIVYGKADILPTPESHHLNHNTTWYGSAKIANEQMLNALSAQARIPGVALRYFNIYGPRMATQGHTEVLVKWLQALESGKPVKIFGDGSQTMDWVHVRDIAQANILAAKSDCSRGVFNVGSGAETSLYDLGKLVMNVWGHSEGPERDLSQNPTNPIPRRWADITAARKHLGYAPKVSLTDGLTEMIRLWKAQAAHA